MKELKTTIVQSLIKENPEEADTIRKVAEACWKQWCTERIAEEEIIDYMLRYQVKPVIKGEITKGKIKWRGLSIARCITDNIFLGLMQRGKFIEPDWRGIHQRAEMRRFSELWMNIFSLRMRRAEAVKYFTGGLYEQMKNIE